MNGVIYMYTSHSGKSYIGQTIDEEKRKSQHIRAALNYNSQLTFHKAIRKYGFENFEYEVLHKNIQSKQEMNILEEMEILNRNTIVPNGYNLNSGGLSQLPSEETKKKLSKANKGKKRTAEQIKYMLSQRKPHKKIVRSKEYIEKLKESIKNSDYTKTEEHRKKLSQSLTGKDNPWIYKSIVCVDYMWIFESVKLASYILGVGHTAIVGCCKHKYKQAKGYRFCYYDENRSEQDYINECDYTEHKRKKKVLCIETGVVFDTVKDAALFAGVSAQHIGNICSGKKKTAKGYTFRYA